jgi:dipeptidase D
MMVLTDNSLQHGPLECLFTVDEESGMTGARNLKPGFLNGQILLNLDSEDWGELFIGCAGGIDTLGTFSFGLKDPVQNTNAFRLSVSGLRGGHSGDEIHKSPGNAIKVLTRILMSCGKEYQSALSLFDGGNLRNAIPREAFAEFTIPEDKRQDFRMACTAEQEKIQEELKEFEPGLAFKLEEIKIPDKVLQAREQAGFLQSLNDCPHGVINWSSTIDDLVQTSTNLASVKFDIPGKARVTTSQRSSVESEKMDISERISNCLRQGGATTEHANGYPGWTPNVESKILLITSESYTKLFGNEPIVRAIHAGLECGLILEKYPGLDMVSFGPTIKGAHTPEERLHIETTGRFWELLVEVLKRVPADA